LTDNADKTEQNHKRNNPETPNSNITTPLTYAHTKPDESSESEGIT